jgi:hypothetical protein
VRSFIQPQHKEKTDTLTCSIPLVVSEGLRLYCEYLNGSPQGYVVGEVLRKAMKKDKGFNEWLAQRAPEPRSAARVTALPSPTTATLQTSVEPEPFKAAK